MATNRQSGFTLIEIAIVLVIIGLLLGGVLKGQELITGARVRNFIQQQDGVKAAYFGFLDRYRGLPGDYAQASANIAGITSTCGTGAGNGDGDGQIEASGTTPTTADEHTLVWEHLQKAGFINGSFTCAATASAATSPTNPYGQPLVMIFDNVYAVASGTATNRHNLKTGGLVPPEILAEIDRKVDDGNAVQGSFRGSGANTSNVCWSAAGVWTATAPAAGCGGATLF